MQLQLQLIPLGLLAFFTLLISPSAAVHRAQCPDWTLGYCCAPSVDENDGADWIANCQKAEYHPSLSGYTGNCLLDDYEFRCMNLRHHETKNIYSAAPQWIELSMLMTVGSTPMATTSTVTKSGGEAKATHTFTLTLNLS